MRDVGSVVRTSPSRSYGGLVERLHQATLAATLAAYSAGYGLVGMPVLLLSVLARVLVTRAWPRASLCRPLAVFVAVAVLSALGSQHRAVVLWNVAALLVISIPITAALADAIPRDGPLPYLAAWLAGGVLAALWGVHRFVPAGAAGATTPMLHWNQLGTTLAVAGALATGLALAARQRRAVWAAALVVVLVGLALTLARAAWVAYVVGTLTMLLATRGERRDVAMTTLLVCVTLGITGALGWAAVRADIITLLAPQSYYGRLALAETALRMLRERPLLGHGLGTFGLLYGQYRPPWAPDPWAHYAHNVVLNVAAETGVLGTAAFLVLCATAVRGAIAWYRRAAVDSTDLGMALGVLGALVTLFVNQLGDSTVMAAHVGVGFFALLTLAADAGRAGPGRRWDGA